MTPRYARAAVLAVLLGATTAAAQEVRVPGVDALRPRAFTPAVVTQPQLTLSDAVRLTLLHSPVLASETQRVQGAAGRQQQNRGPFDTTFKVGPRLTYTQAPANPFLLDRELTTRKTLFQIAETFTSLTAELRAMAASLEPRSPRCPRIYVNLSTNFLAFSRGSTTNPQASVYVDTKDEQELRQIGVQGDLGASAVRGLQSLIGGMDLCSMGGGPDPVTELAAYYNALDRVSRIDYAGGYGLQGILTSVSQVPREVRTLQAQIADAVATRARLAHTRLGAMPVDELKRQVEFTASLARGFRSGLRVTGAVMLESREQNFKDKPFDPTFGGLAQPTQFPSTAALALDIPLGKGRGATTTAAPERASTAALGAQRDQARHAASEEVFRTVLAYLALVGAQQREALYEESAARQEKLATLAEQQVNGGDLPAMELGRVRARAAAVQALLRQARADLVGARIGLADLVGLPASAPSLPVAEDSFATGRATMPATDVLVRTAVAQRRDIRAVRGVLDATAILSAGASASERRRLDLSISGGVRNLYESPFFRYLPDEQDPIYSNFSTPPTRRTPVRFYSPTGFGRSLTLRWEPFVDAQITFDLPFGNNAARGHAAQARADLRAREIQAADLERVVRQNVIGLRGALDNAASAVERAEASVRYGEQVLSGSLAQFEAAELTLLDTLITEEELTRDKLELVRLREAYLATLARLRYETGSLLLVDSEGAGAEVLRFAPVDLIGRQ